MSNLVILLLLASAAFVLEEFILIKPVFTITQSDLLSKRLETVAFWLPAFGMVATAATMGIFGGIRFAGLINGVGLIFCAIGITLRYWARRTLGRFFTIGVVKQAGHQVIQEGPYRLIRHPAYLAFMFFYTGFPLLIGNWVGLLILTLPAVFIFAWLTLVEDKRLAEELGKEYQEYQRHSARLIPNIW